VAATIFNFIAAFFIGKRAAKKPFDFEENGINSAFAQGDVQIQEVKVDARFFINWALTIGSFVLIFKDVIQSYYVFMLAMVLALAVNYKTVKEWNSAIDRFAPGILRMVMMVFTAGVFVGILTKSNMMSEMAQSIINIIPTSASRSFGLITTGISYITDPLFTNDAYYAGVLPLFMTVAESIAYPAMSVCVAILLIRDSMQQVSPAQSRPWQMSAMLGVEYIDCMKALLPPLTLQIILQVVVAVITGAIAV
jgi:CitMHS family citrate-Mg2+:H+ or citrate-Ca2+:H+ symporter